MLPCGLSSPLVLKRGTSLTAPPADVFAMFCRLSCQPPHVPTACRGAQVEQQNVKPLISSPQPLPSTSCGNGPGTPRQEAAATHATVMGVLGLPDLPDLPDLAELLGMPEHLQARVSHREFPPWCQALSASVHAAVRMRSLTVLGQLRGLAAGSDKQQCLLSVLNTFTLLACLCGACGRDVQQQGAALWPGQPASWTARLLLSRCSWPTCSILDA